MRVSRLLGLTVVATFAVLFLGSATVMAGGEHPWIENPATPPLPDTGQQVHEAIEPIGPETPVPVVERLVFNFIPLWWQAIIVHRISDDRGGAIIDEARSHSRMHLFGGVRITVPSPPK